MEVQVDKIKPCPFCGNKGVIKVCDKYDMYYVECHICQAKIKPCKSEILAISIWNHRFQQES